MRFALILAAFFFTLPAFGRGGMTSGDLGRGRATKERPTFRAPWFAGSASVRYCLERGENFTIALDPIRAALNDAFGDWKATFAKVRMEPLPPDTRAQGTLSLDFVEVPCRDWHELTFYFGAFPDGFGTAVRGEKSLPAAFAYVNAYDSGTGRARGFIWLSPDRGPKRFEGRDEGWNRVPEGFWGRASMLHNALVHELGHVFGLPHLTFTAMSEEVVQLMENGVAPEAHTQETSAELVMDPEDLAPTDRLCAQGYNSSFHPVLGHMPDKTDGSSRLCLRTQNRAWNEALAGGFEIEQSFLPEGGGESDWSAPVAIGRLAEMRESTLPPVAVAGRYRTRAGKVRAHEFFRLRPERNWKGTFRAANGDACPAELHTYNRQSFVLMLHCGEEESYTAYFADSPLFGARPRVETSRN